MDGIFWILISGNSMFHIFIIQNSDTIIVLLWFTSTTSVREKSRFLMEISTCLLRTMSILKEHIDVNNDG